MAKLGILKDFPISGTPLRGLVVQGPFCLCAYVGVPREHWLANMDELSIPCHWGITFSGEGDGDLRPENWYWFGWDYGHCSDAWSLADELPQEVKEAMAQFSAGTNHGARKKWGVEEIELEIIDVAIGLMPMLEQSEQRATALLGTLTASSP